MDASQLLSIGATLAVILFAGFAAVRYFIGYRRSGLRLYGTVTVTAFLVIEAQIAMHVGSAWHGTFWLYHVQLLSGCLLLLAAVVGEYRRGRATRSLQQLTTSDIVRQLRSGDAESVLGLTAALEGRDGYTLGHGERVAALAILMGQEMRLSMPRLRALATGALLLDVGKIGVPDAVLHKHGALTAEERTVVQEHPLRGHSMVTRRWRAPSNAGSCGTTMSAGTARATRTGCRARRSASKRASPPSPTCTTRCARTARIAGRSRAPPR